MRIKYLGLFTLLAACSGDDGATRRDGGIDAYIIDAPETVPTITSFTASPISVPSGVATSVTWNWTYANEPTLPDPACSIDNGVGPVTRGMATTVMISQVTTFTLTCTNRAGIGMKILVLAVPPVAPSIATFTATPSPLMPNTATAVTFSWTYTTMPSPMPTCTIDAGIGAATNGMQTTLTLGQARTYRLRCTNTQGTSFRDATVSVNECAGGTASCGANSACTDTPESYTCTCNAGYAGNGDICSASGVTCGQCSANATCVGTSQCVCNAGYFGDGLTCTRARLMFVTSTAGTGTLAASAWGTAAGAATGLAAADNICQAAAASIPGVTGTFKAWMSDSTHDAYCRIHNLDGTKATGCGLGAGNLPVAAGPWVRTDAARSPAAPAIDKLIAPTRQTFYPVTYTETGTDVGASTPQILWTGTDENGAYSGSACGDWTGSVTGTAGLLGSATSWSNSGSPFTCSSSGRLLCVEVGTGPALPPRHPANAKKAFLTSVSGGSVFSAWADANLQTGIAAADEVCKARARYAGYTNAPNFKAWMSGYYVAATTRITYNGPWYRPDGILVASSETDMTDGRVAAPLNMTEANQYIAGNDATGSVWTGSYYYGSYYSSSTSGHCYMWTSQAYTAIVGRHDLSDYRWFSFGTSSSSPSFLSCTANDYRIYCVDDSP